MSQSSKVWFITGCSSGFGAALTHEILSRGDKVIATARNASKLSDLKLAGANILELDVTAPLDKIKSVAKQAHEIHGHIDYLINNAGYSLQGTFEELTPEETQGQFDTNVFGLINVTRAILPYFRAQRSGAIANLSSIGAWRAAPGMGMYMTSKWAVSGISETMRDELADFGIKVCCVEPGYFRSNFLNPGNRKTDESRIKEYDGTAARKMAEMMDAYDNHQPGDIKKGAKVMVDVLSGDNVPLRLPLGSDCYAMMKEKCEETLKLLEEWKDVITSTDHDDTKQ
ncbi:hypothetical protein PMZ80_009281 [Knufia obscura]|uniref:Uncharacterized protein n=2 Tax=Knufia TaxID=430999 RepID=A0AAN8EXD8_9EURO|nr:hypothetical protein PMZ80_009281 [Knufia obscura]KAK5955741.1 hypothetical protein OHC33_003382 [Knufia fluminis]